MKLLADESVDFGAVRALRASGCDVVAVAELEPGIPDPEVAARASQQSLVLLTEDKDFGNLAYAAGALASGVILIRFPANLRSEMISSVVEIVRESSEKIAGHFVVIQPGRARFSKLRER